MAYILKRFNQRHQRVGPLLQGRYQAILVDKEHYLLTLGRYVVLNPVRAKIVKDPGDWKWST
jgi:REP element-mobilizing transposase RayT